MDLGKIWHLRQSKEWSKERVVKIGSALRPVQYKKKMCKSSASSYPLSKKVVVVLLCTRGSGLGKPILDIRTLGQR